MVNCNPETVSTDYDTRTGSFRAATAETRSNHRDRARQRHAARRDVQFGGQTRSSSRRRWSAPNIPILGTSPDAIDLPRTATASSTCSTSSPQAPNNGIAYSVEQARLVAADLGYPIVVRPSYVLGGRAMQIIREGDQLATTCSARCPSWCRTTSRRATQRQDRADHTVLGKNPLLFDRYLSDAVEVDVDCIADGKDTFIAGIMEHIEEAAFIPAIPPARCRRTTSRPRPSPRSTARPRARAGAQGRRPDERAIRIKDGDIYVLEVNPRGRPHGPFVAKVIGLPVAKIGAHHGGREPRELRADARALRARAGDPYRGKGGGLPFRRFGEKVDTVLGPE